VLTGMGDAVFRVLGPVQVIRDGAEVTSLDRGTLTDLLAALIVSPGQLIAADTLIETVWHDQPAAHPRAALHSAVARLRRMIGGDFIQTFGPGYRFRADADQVDLLTFGRLRAAAARQESGAALAALTEALELWRGTPLENVVSPVLLTEAVPRLTELHLRTCEEWAGLCLREGQHELVVTRLASLVEAHPFREQLTEQLMLALYRSSRQADAIRAYEALRRALSDEMGMEPSPALQHLQLKILRADPSLHGAPRQAAPVARSASGPGRDERGRWPAVPVVVPHQLPRDLPDFCGRQAELEELTGFLTGSSAVPGETPVMVLSGKGGIGKTALAIRAAHRVSAAFPDGQLVANLHGNGLLPVPAGAVLASFLRALGVHGAAIPRSVQDRVTMFRSLTAGRRVLLGLDNAASESQVRQLLPASNTCAVIVTSRACMAGLPGARLVNLDVLDDDHAMHLLVRIIGPERVAAERHDAEALVSLCGGLPLALRIVGTRLAAKPHWPLAVIRGRLADERHRLSELAYGDLDVRASFAVSYAQLDEAAKAMLRRLSLLDAPDFPAWAGAALLDTSPDEAVRICERLVDAQLLDPAARQTPAGIRYQFHDLVRAFARDHANKAESEAARTAALNRAFGAWLALAERAHRHVYRGDYTVLHGRAGRWTKAGAAVQQAIQRNPVDWLEGERLAILAAVRQSAELGRHEVSWDLAWTAVTLWEARAYYGDWSEAAEHALAAARSAGDMRGTAAMVTCLASLRVASQDYPRARELAEQAVRLFGEARDVHGCALARFRVGVALAGMGHSPAAIGAYQQARREAHEAGDVFMEAGVLRELGNVHLQRGDYDEAARCVTGSLLLHMQIGSVRGQALALHTLGELRLRQGDPQAAKVLFEHVLGMIQPASDIVGQAHVTLGLGQALASAGLRGQAEEPLRTALRLGQQVRNRTIEDRARRALDRLTASTT